MLLDSMHAWAVFTAAAAQFVLGWLWYGPLFGKPWASALGMDTSQKIAKTTMVRSMLLMLLGSLLMAYVLYNGIVFGNAFLDTEGWRSGVTAAFWYWLGFFAPVTLGPILWEHKPWKLWFINAGYYLAGLCLMGGILAGWK